MPDDVDIDYEYEKAKAAAAVAAPKAPVSAPSSPSEFGLDLGPDRSFDVPLRGIELPEGQSGNYITKADEDLAEADALTGQRNASNPEFRKAFETDGRLDPVKTAAHLEQIRKAHAEAIPAVPAVATHFGRAVASGTTLGFWKGGLSEEESALLDQNRAVQGPAGQIAGTAGMLLAAANPVGPVAGFTRGAQALKIPTAGAVGFGLAQGIEQRSPAAGLEGYGFAAGAGGIGGKIAGENASRLRAALGEAAGVGATATTFEALHGHGVDWLNVAAQMGGFGLLKALNVSPISPEGKREVIREIAATEVRPDTPPEVVAAIGHARLTEAEYAKAAEREAAVRPEAEPTPGEPIDVTIERGQNRLSAQAAPEAPAAPREEVIQPKAEEPAPKVETPPPVEPPSPPAPKATESATPIGGGPTAPKNRIVNAEREARGLEPVADTEPQTREGWRERGQKIVAENPSRPHELVDEILRKPRNLTPEENAVLLVHRVNTNRALESADAAGVEAAKRGDADAVATAQANAERALADRMRLDEAGKAAGAEWGRGGVARQMEMAADYSLARIQADIQRENGYKPLTEADRAEARDLFAKVEAARKELAAYEARKAEIDAQRSLGRVRTSESRRAPRESAEYGKANKVVTREAYEATKAALREKLNRMNVGIDPTILADLAKMGVFHVEAGVRGFARWAEAMTEGLSDKERAKVEPRLQAAWLATHKELSGKVIEDVSGKIRTGIEAGKSLDKMAGDVGRIAETFIAQGVENRGELIGKVHDVLKTIDPEITRRETAVALSGYGKITALNNDPIKVKLRELKGQVQQELKLEDMAGGKPPLKSGPERQAPGDVQRELIRLVNEAKKRGGYDVRDPETQLKSALDGAKTRMRNGIADMARQIAALKKDVPNRTRLELDAEAAKLKTEYDAMRAKYNEVFGKPGMTDAQRVEAAIKATEKSIAELERKIQTGDVFPAKRPEGPTDPRLEAARATRDALREQANDIREAARPRRSPSEIADQMRKTRLKNEIAFLENAVATGQLDRPARREAPVADAETIRLQARMEMARKAVNEAIFKRRIANENAKQKAVRAAMEVNNLSRAFMTSPDFSAVLRQGIFRVLGHPIEAARAMGPMFKAFGSPIAGGHAMAAAEKAGVNPFKAVWDGINAAGEAGRRARAEAEAEIKARPNYHLMRQAGVHFSEHGSVTLDKMEEAYQSRLAEHVPFVAGSGRAFTTFINRIRADAFDAMAASFSNGPRLTPEEAKAVGAIVNTITGRGGAQDSKLLNGLSAGIWSPRLLASRIQLLYGHHLFTGTARTKIAMAKEYGRFLIGAGVVYGLAALSGADIETDPTNGNPDFGKIKIGNTRLDPMGGLLQVTRLLATEGHSTLAHMGVIRKNRQDERSLQTLGKFLRSKFTPLLGSAVNLMTGEDFKGDPTDIGNEAVNLVTPMALMDVKKAMEDQGVPTGTALGILSLFGMGLQTYAKKKPKGR